MNDVDRLLQDAGDRWRSAQPAPPVIEATAFVESRRAFGASLSVVGACLTIVVIAALALGRLATPGSPVDSSPDGSAGSAASPGVAAASPLPSRGTSQGTSAGTDSTGTPGCNVTLPRPVFVPPGPYLPNGRYVATPPDIYESDWFGSGRLWTMLGRKGEIWRELPSSAAGLSQKTFWWSVDWVPQDELEPAITVSGRRLDGLGSFTFGPGTNATADFGTAMLVGIEVPTTGCWEITGRYRAASLSVVVSIEDPQPN